MEPTTLAPEPVTPLLKNPIAEGNKGITAAIATVLVSALTPILSDKLPGWLQVDPGVALPAIGLSLQNLFARLRQRRIAKKAMARAAGSR